MPIIAGLEAIQADIEQGDFDWSVALEDIHMNIEARLIERIGETGKKLHTGRSRNDQVATDLRLYLRDEIDGLCVSLGRLQAALVDIADTRGRHHHARVYPPAGCHARQLRASHAGLGGNAGARPSAPARLP